MLGWWKLTVTLRSGVEIVLYHEQPQARKLYTAVRRELGLTERASVIDLHAWTKTPVVVKKQITIDPREVVAVSLEDCPQFTHAMTPDDLETVAQAEGFTLPSGEDAV